MFTRAPVRSYFWEPSALKTGKTKRVRFHDLIECSSLVGAKRNSKNSWDLQNSNERLIRQFDPIRAHVARRPKIRVPVLLNYSVGKRKFQKAP